MEKQTNKKTLIWAFQSLVLVTDAGSDKLFNKKQEVDSEDYSGLRVAMIYSWCCCFMNTAKLCKLRSGHSSLSEYERVLDLFWLTIIHVIIKNTVCPFPQTWLALVTWHWANFSDHCIDVGVFGDDADVQLMVRFTTRDKICLLFWGINTTPSTGLGCGGTATGPAATIFQSSSWLVILFNIDISTT